MDFSLQALKMCWIPALPAPFIPVQAKFTQGSKLPDKWEAASSVNMLYQATKHWGTIYNIFESASLLLKAFHLLRNPMAVILIVEAMEDVAGDRAGRGDHSNTDCPTPAWGEKKLQSQKKTGMTTQLLILHLNSSVPT